MPLPAKFKIRFLEPVEMDAPRPDDNQLGEDIRALIQENLLELVARRLLGELQLLPLISHRVPFSRAAEAYELVDRHAEDVVQVVLTYGGK